MQKGYSLALKQQLWHISKAYTKGYCKECLQTQSNKMDKRSENSFDFLRVFSALMVLLSHSYPLFGLPEPKPIFGITLGSLSVAFFFSISGFLIYQSWISTQNLLKFFLKRFRRIYPGLIFVSFLTAFILGPLSSTLSWNEYLLSGTAINYLISVGLSLNDQGLLGVFEKNPYPNTVNGSLWTLKYEILMYATLAFAGVLVPARHLTPTIASLLVIFSASWVFISVYELQISDIKITNKAPFFWRLSVELKLDRIAYLGAFFFAGSTFSIYKNKIPINGRITLLLWIILLTLEEKTLAMICLWFTVPYTAVYFAYNSPKIFQKINGHDYSYGIYIYAFPIQQTLSLWAVKNHFSWITCVSLSILLTLTFSAFSWHFIESPFLRYKNRKTTPGVVCTPPSEV